MPPDDQTPTTPTLAQPVATPAESAAGAVSSPPAQTPAAGAEPAANGDSEPAGRFVPLDRFNGVVAQKYEAIRRSEQAEQRARELEQQLQRFAAPATGADPTAPQAPRFDPAEIDRLASQRAAAMNFKEKVDGAVAAGRSAHPDFDATIAELQKVAPMRDVNGAPMIPPSVVEAAIRTGAGAEVLYALGKDTLEADRIMSLDPIGQAVEVAKLAQRLTPQASAEPATATPPDLRVVRGAPPEPIRPVVGAARGREVKDMALDDPELPIEEFMRRRDEEAKRHRGIGGRFR